MKVGDKYVIEIEEVIRRNGAPQIARIKGFNALVFDKYGLEKLEPYEDNWENVYRKGYEDGMKAMQEQNAEIKVGDEVIDTDGEKGIVVKDAFDCETTKYTLVWYGTYTSSKCIDRLTKTGRHFDEIPEILSELRGKE